MSTRRNNNNNTAASSSSNNNNKAASSNNKKEGGSKNGGGAGGALPESITVDGKQVNINDLEVSALFDYLRANPDNRTAKRCAIYPECTKGRDCTFAHLKQSKLAQFVQTAQATAPHPYEDKSLIAYAHVPELVIIDGRNYSIHELEPNNLFNYLRANPEKNSAKACANFPNCTKGKDCSFAHLKSVRMNALSGANAGRNGSKAVKNNNNQGGASSTGDEADLSSRGLLAYDGLPSHVLVDGHHMPIHDLEPNNLFNYFLQHPTSPTAKRCASFPFCARGKDCSFGHLKSIKIKALIAAQERQQQGNNNHNNNNRASSNNNNNNNNVDEKEFAGLPNTVLVDSVVVNIHDLEPNALFDYLRSNNDSQAARRCQFFPSCPKGKSCGFAHVKYARVEPGAAFANAKPSAADYNGLPETILIDSRKFNSTDLEPTLLFDFIRLHPEADNVKRCRNFPYCRSGRSCGYAHLKSDRAAAISGMPAFLTIEEERVDVLKTLHPTAMFHYARKYPESNTIKWCKHHPNCQDGDACTYAHKKQ